MSKNRIYLDNAATSFPKPKAVISSIEHFMGEVGAGPGRAAHMGAIEAGEILFEAREKIAALCGIMSPMRVIFCSSATEALNTAILGTLNKGDHVITTSFEHNSTIRPLKYLEEQGVIELTIVPPYDKHQYTLDCLEKCLKHNTKAIVFNHASNVFGTTLSLEIFAKFARKHRLLSICDASQSMGTIPIDIGELGIDLIGFPGHKGLCGPMGTGVLAINDRFDIDKMRPLMFGGTGSASDQITQPNFLPDKYESGTHNMIGIAGLSASIDMLQQMTIQKAYLKKKELVDYFYQCASEMPQIETYVHPKHIETGTISFNLKEMSSSELGFILSDNYNIQTRVGLHCSPLAHESMGTFPSGTVRISFGIYSEKSDLDALFSALKEIVGGV